MALDVYHAFLPSLEPIDSETLLPDDGSPLFDDTLAGFAQQLSDERFADLKALLEAPAPVGHLIDIVIEAAPEGFAAFDEDDIESTAVLPVITDDAPGLWIPGDVGSQHTSCAA